LADGSGKSFSREATMVRAKAVRMSRRRRFNLNFSREGAKTRRRKKPVRILCPHAVFAPSRLRVNL
jgi:hypothetical protein